MEIIEIPHFTDQFHHCLEDEEYSALQWFLCRKPDAGDLIRGTGGARKVRWASKNKGKSGGVRTIYFHHTPKGQIWMLAIYPKSEKEDLSAQDKRVLKEIIVEIKK